MDIALFRQSFPEFNDPGRYPNSMINFWATAGEAQLNQARWGNLYTLGLYLWVAHHVTLAEERVATANEGSTPGTEAGAETSRHVDLATVQYDATASAEKNGGAWNQTGYGRDYYKQARKVGAGGRFVGGGPFAWPAPYYPYPLG